LSQNDKQGKSSEGSNLVQFQTHQAGHEGGGRSNGRDNLPRNLLCGVSISYVDIVVHRPKIRCCSDEVDVIIGIIILLEFDRCKTIACQRRRRGQFRVKILKIFIYRNQLVVGCIGIERQVCVPPPPACGTGSFSVI
jgi:hypothetical protein